MSIGKFLRNMRIRVPIGYKVRLIRTLVFRLILSATTPVGTSKRKVPMVDMAIAVPIWAYVRPLDR